MQALKLQQHESMQSKVFMLKLPSARKDKLSNKCLKDREAQTTAKGFKIISLISKYVHSNSEFNR